MTNTNSLTLDQMVQYLNDVTARRLRDGGRRKRQIQAALDAGPGSDAWQVATEIALADQGRRS